jgi:hypothetical protein
MKTIIWTLAHLLSYLFVVTAKDCDMLTAAPLEASADIRALIELSDQQIAGFESEIDIWGSIGKKRSTLVCERKHLSRINKTKTLTLDRRRFYQRTLSVCAKPTVLLKSGVCNTSSSLITANTAL